MQHTFTATGLTILVAAAVSPPTGVQAVGQNNSTPHYYRISNTGLGNAFVASGGTAALAQTNAVIPTATPQPVYVLNSGDSIVVNDRVEAFWSAATAAGTASVFVTPGYVN